MLFCSQIIKITVCVVALLTCNLLFYSKDCVRINSEITSCILWSQLSHSIIKPSTCKHENLKKTKKFLTKKNLKSVGMTLAKVEKQDRMALAKVKEQDGMTLAKVRHAQVSHNLIASL